MYFLNLILHIFLRIRIATKKHTAYNSLAQLSFFVAFIISTKCVFQCVCLLLLVVHLYIYRKILFQNDFAEL